MRQLRRSLVWGLAIALLVTLTMTILDWHENPGGVFHGNGITHWRFVWDTAWSWFAPTFIYAVVIAWLAQIVYAGYKRTRERMGW